MDELELYRQFQGLSLSYPKLRLQKAGKGPWFVRGKLGFSKESSKHEITDEYLVEILVPEKYPEAHPITREVGNRIPKDFHHNPDESLCLGVPIAIKIKFRHEPTLLGFVNNCVVPYLYSFSYKSKFGKMPFGELSHGGLGFLEYYQELFDIKDRRRVLRLIQILAEDSYQGHARCPCGKGKRIQACHGKILLDLKQIQSPVEFLGEYQSIVSSLVGEAMRQPYR